jgi:hypothetical protein
MRTKLTQTGQQAMGSHLTTLSSDADLSSLPTSRS